MPGLDLKSWLLSAAIVAVAGIVRGFSGFGAGLVMAPSLSLLLGPTVAVPVIVLLDAVAGAQLIPPAIRHVRWRTVGSLGLAACVGVPLGSLGLARLDPTIVEKSISAVVLLFVLALASGWRYQSQPNLAITLATGGLGGFLTGMAGVGGPPVILFFISGPSAAPAVRSSLICYLGITQAAGLIAFAFTGLLTKAVVLIGAVLLPVFLAAIHLGTRLFGHVNERVFRGATLVLLVAIALTGLFG